MSYPVVIENAQNKVGGLTLAGTVIRGNLIGHNGTNWVQADATSGTNYFAEYIALQTGASGDIIKGCRSCVLYDEDAPYTAAAEQYVSTTAGAITETMPTTGGDTIQVVGRAISTKRVKIDIQAPKVFEAFFEADTYNTTGEGAVGTADTSWTGPQLDANTETAYVKGRLPCNMVELLQARVLFNSIGATAFDIDFSITGGFDGADNNEDTGAAQTTQGMDSGADNKLAYVDVHGASHLMDAGFALPGRNFSIFVDMDGITAGDVQLLGCYIRCLVV